MKLLKWNCQGLGNSWTIQSLHKLVRDQAPTVCFLMETRLDKKGFAKHGRDLPFQNKFIVKKPYSGGGGGLALLWKSEVRLDVLNYIENHILAKVVEDDGFTWFLTGFYGWLEDSEKKKSWVLLSHISSFVDGPWCCIGIDRDFRRSGSRGFRFEESWLMWEDCEGVVMDSWTNSGGEVAGLRATVDKIKECGADLLAWGSAKTAPAVNEIKMLTKKIEKMNEEELMEESREERCKRNFIQGIQNQHGNWVEDIGEVAEVAINYFETIFHSGTYERMEECLNTVPQKMTTEITEELTRLYSVEEVKTALFQMGPTKAPGPDGMNALFYQKFWHIVGNDVCSAVLDFLNSGTMLPEINYTHIVLIPKVKSPEKMTDFRPISLCNIIYKIISKVLANRLKIILPQLISPTQSAFVPGRLITDNVLLAYETLHAMHGRKKGKKGTLALKLDVSKAYDQVEWDFLKGMMIRLGFLGVWINRVMSCVSTPSISVRINGKAYGNIIPSRGLRQGDPLSPYLFLLCAEGFTSLLSKAEFEGRLHGVQICRRAPCISHLLFADDSLIFFQANQEEVQEVSNTLHLYAEASGQCINFEKSSAYFSSNTSERQRQWIKQALGVREVDRFDSYLGLLTLVGRAKYQTFAYLKERVWKKLQGWKGKMLSRARKEVLIKAVAQSIPTYTMGVFLLPEGGMGFRDIRSFNLAMLAKQGWRLTQDQDSLLTRCFKTKYFPRCSFLEAADCPNSSYVWKSVLVAQNILQTGCYWRVGTGSSIRVKEDKWIPNHPENKVLFPTENDEWEWRVLELIDWNVHRWDRERIYMCFNQFDTEAILKITLSRRHVQDRLVWKFGRKGKYEVKSGYHMARMLDGDTNGREESAVPRRNHRLWNQLWQLHEDRCDLCRRYPETIVHAIWDCSAAQDVWAGSTVRIQKCGGEFDDFMQLFHAMMAKLSVEELETFLVQCWLIWHHRNSLLYGGSMQHPVQLNKRATDYLKEYQEAQSSLAVGSLYKLNFDAAIFANSSGIGVVIRNAAGEVMTALSARGAVVINSEEAEAMACRKALEFAIDAGFSELVVEGDNSVVLSSVSSTNPDWSCLGVIYDYIRHLAAGLHYVSFNCIRRGANSIAHSLARYANVLDEEVVWLEDSLPPAHDALYFDSSFLNE
ncbi:uncharacterized protein LOC126690119 [Quercus robur]|uniref:uncharacterized protein LOC126690119 n=1 Tax=Quercus robur TaxID=38942 RepID=UPI0021637323|nr:uncharacterized protein LOC126690119 [Quercus robur]